MKKYFILGAIFGSLLIGSAVLGAPTYRIERTLIPEADNTYDLGTSTRIWANGYFNLLRVANLNNSTSACVTANSLGVLSLTPCGGSFTTTTINGLSATTYTFVAGTSTSISSSSPGTIIIGLATNTISQWINDSGYIIPTGQYFTLSGTSLYPTSTAYQLGIGTTTLSNTLTVSTGTIPHFLVKTNGQALFGAGTHLNSTSTAFVIVNPSSTAQGFTLYQQTPTNNQDLMTVCRGTVTANCQQRVFALNQFGELRLGQSNSTGQLTVDATNSGAGNFTQIINFYNSNTATGGTLLNLGSASPTGGTLRFSASTGGGDFGSTAQFGRGLYYIANQNGVGSWNDAWSQFSAPTNTYKSRQFVTNNTNVGSREYSADSLTVSGGNLSVYNANQYGGGLGSEVLSGGTSTITSSSATGYTSTGSFTIYPTSSAFFSASGASVGTLSQASTRFATSLKPDTYYYLSYTIAGLSGTTSFFVCDPAGTNCASTSVQSTDTSWQKFGTFASRANISNGTNGFFFKTEKTLASISGVPFVLRASSTGASAFTISSLSLKEARGGQVQVGDGGAFLIGITAPTSTSGLHIKASSTATSSNVFALYPSNALTTASSTMFAVADSGILRTTEDVYITTSTKGLVLTSPNNTCYRLTITDAGAFSTSSITCP